jgi:ABC-type antimicrobial peptide transport system permease subunit
VELTAIPVGRGSHGSQECAPHRIRTAESAGGSDLFEALVRSLQLPAHSFGSHLQNIVGRRFSELASEHALEIPNAHCGSVCQLTIAPRRFNLQLLSAFALAALALALAGIYGVISFSVNQRAHEIGVRMAMGARHSHVLRMVIADGIKPVLAGLAFGILCVFALSKVLARMVYVVSASDSATLAAVTLMFGGVSLATLYLPARRATKIDPLVIVRTD